MEKEILIRRATTQDAEEITNIYNYYIKNSVITFEEIALKPTQMVERINNSQGKYLFLVAVLNGEVIGYAYTSRFRERSAYINTASISIYLDKDYAGKGVGTSLYKKLINFSKEQNIKTLIAVVVSGNDFSSEFHKKNNFTKMGQLKLVGYKFDRWLDVEYWQIMLN